MFSSSHPSRRKSRIRRLSLIFATLDTSISSSVFSVRFAHSSSYSVSRCACHLLPTSRCLELHLERHSLRQRFQHFGAKPPATTLLALEASPPAVASLRFALLELTGSAGLSANWSLIRLAARLPCPVCGVQPLPVVVGPSLFLEGVLPFLHGKSLSDLVVVCLLALLCTRDTLGQAVRVEVRMFQVHYFRRSCFSRWLGKEALSGSWLRSRRSPMGRTPLLAGVQVTWPDRYVDDLLTVGPPFWHKSPSDLSEQWSLHHSQSRCTHWTSSRNRRIYQVPSCLLLSFDLSTDRLDTTLFLRTRICPCVRDLATVRMVLSHQAQLCPGSARWWRAQSSKQMDFDSGGICI